MMEMVSVAQDGTFAEFERVYSPDGLNFSAGWHTPLTSSFNNRNITERIRIADFLIDAGADLALKYPVHNFLATKVHDFVAEAPLLLKMFERGADVNLREPRGDTPLEALVFNMKWADDEVYRPFYEVIYARPDLDLLSENRRGDSVVTSVRKAGDYRPLGIALLNQALAARGIDVPPSA